MNTPTERAYKAARQRKWRENKRRIDLYISPAAGVIVDKLALHRYVGTDYSSVINMIIEQWAALKSRRRTKASGKC